MVSQKTINMQMPCTREQMAYIQEHLKPKERVRAMLDAADIASGARYKQLTEEMTEKNAQAVILAPMFIGADSTDIETFVSEVWARPVTNENYMEVMQLFKAWYKLVAPGEYHDPQPTASLREAGYGDDRWQNPRTG